MLAAGQVEQVRRQKMLHPISVLVCQAKMKHPVRLWEIEVLHSHREAFVEPCLIHETVSGEKAWRNRKQFAGSGTRLSTRRSIVKSAFSPLSSIKSSIADRYCLRSIHAYAETCHRSMVKSTTLSFPFLFEGKWLFFFCRLVTSAWLDVGNRREEHSPSVVNYTKKQEKDLTEKVNCSKRVLTLYRRR